MQLCGRAGNPKMIEVRVIVSSPPSPPQAQPEEIVLSPQHLTRTTHEAHCLSSCTHLRAWFVLNSSFRPRLTVRRVHRPNSAVYTSHPFRCQWCYLRLPFDGQPIPWSASCMLPLLAQTTATDGAGRPFPFTFSRSSADPSSRSADRPKKNDVFPRSDTPWETALDPGSTFVVRTRQTSSSQDLIPPSLSCAFFALSDPRRTWCFKVPNVPLYNSSQHQHRGRVLNLAN